MCKCPWILGLTLWNCGRYGLSVEWWDIFCQSTLASFQCLCTHVTLFDLQSAFVRESGQKIVYKQGNWNQRICKTFSVTQSRLLVAILWANWSHESKARETTRNYLLCCTIQLRYWGINLPSSSFHHINPFLFLSHTRIIPIPTFWGLISASWGSHFDNSRQFLTWELEYLNAETDQMSHFCGIVHYLKMAATIVCLLIALESGLNLGDLRSPYHHTLSTQLPLHLRFMFHRLRDLTPPELSQKMGSSCPFTPLLYLKQQKKGEQTKMDKGTGSKWKPCISRHLSSCLLWMQLRDTGVSRGKSESPALFLASSFLENSWSHFLFEGDTIRASSVIAAGIIPTSENIFFPNI